MFFAGAAKVKITPPLGTVINGDFYTHYAFQIHDDLYAKSLILKNETTTILFVVVDICTLSKSFIDLVKSKISSKCDIPVSNMVICSTHTHAAGSVEEVYLGACDLTYRKQLIPLIVESADIAFRSLRPAKITYGQLLAPEYVKCRRYYLNDHMDLRNPVSGLTDRIKTNPFNLEKFIERPVSDPDTQLSFLAVMGSDGQWISVLANYSLHYVGDWQNGTISADYFGTFSYHIKRLVKGDESFVGMMTNATCGDINIWNFHPESTPPKHFEKSQEIGFALAEKVFSKLANCSWTEDPALKMTSEEITLKVRKPDAGELQSIRSSFTDIDLNKNDYSDQALQIIYAREQLLLNEFPDYCTASLQAIKIGKLLIGMLPGEFFAETGLKLKSHFAPDPYFTIGLANGNIGYVPPASQFELGGYETWRSRYSCMQIDAEAIVRKSLTTLLESRK